MGYEGCNTVAFPRDVVTQNRSADFQGPSSVALLLPAVADLNVLTALSKL